MQKRNPLSRRERIALLGIAVLLGLNVAPVYATVGTPSAELLGPAASTPEITNYGPVSLELLKEKQDLAAQQKELIEKMQAAAELELRYAVIAEASRYVGKVPYVKTGSTPSGWDCSGYTMYVFATVGIDLYHRASVQAAAGKKVLDPQVGDLVVLKQNGRTAHIGIYFGDGMVLDAGRDVSGTALRDIERTFPANRGWTVEYSDVITGHAVTDEARAAAAQAATN